MFTFIESSAFERVCPVYLDEDEYAELQQFMMQNPEAGQVVPGSGAFANYAGHDRVWASRWATRHPFRTLRTERVLDADDLRQG